MTWLTIQTIAWCLVGFAIGALAAWLLAVAIDFAGWLRLALLPNFVVSQTLPLIVVAPSTAVTGCEGLLDETLGALGAISSRTPVRAVISSLDPPPSDTLARAGAATVSFGLGRQDELLADADLVVCGGGHGMLAKSLLAGVPVVVVPGGGDQWELANRVSRQGSGVLVRPADATAIAEAIEAVLCDPSHAAAAARARESANAVTDPTDVLRDVLASAGT